MRKRTVEGAVLVLAAFAAWRPMAWAEVDAAKILSDSHAFVSAHSFQVQETSEQNGRILLPGKAPVDSPSTKQTKVIEVDYINELFRMTTREQGKDMVVLRKGRNVAMKVGSGAWETPQGPFARLGEQMANPFACPLPKQGDKHSPKWRVVGREIAKGEETTVIESVGDTANQYAQERMREGIAAMFPDVNTRPTVEVLDYKSRHWIGKDNRRLRVEQTSHAKMTMPGTPKTVLDMSVKMTAVYSRYDKVEIQVPVEASALLGLK